MYGQAVGFNPNSVLSGLRPGASAFAKGQAMQAASSLGLEREKANQEYGAQQMRADSQQRQAAASNSAQRSQNQSRERIAVGDMKNRRDVFNTGMNFDYAGLARRNQLHLQQALINGIARDF